ncbi:MAG: peptidylprolyl isomerase [Planctomycetota bacterium]
MKIRAGCFVELSYELRGDEGELVEHSEEDGPMVYLHGNEEIPAKIEGELEGRGVGDELHVELEAGVAYGEYNPDGIITVPREQFPPDAEIVPGDWIDVTLADQEGKEPEEAESLEMRVVEISPEAIVLDANHPLAGKACTFDLKVVSVRMGSEEEIEARKEEMKATIEDEDEEES